MYVKFGSKHVHKKIEEGKYTLSDLPLVEIHGKGKKFKEFFSIITDVTPDDQERIRKVMTEDPTKIGDLPDSVRPGGELGEACALQMVIDSSSNSVLNFFHSNISLPWGVVRVFCRDKTMLLNYKIASNSDLVKCAFMVMLSNIAGDQWLTQSLGEKLKRPTKDPSDKDGSSWEPSAEKLKEGIDFINSQSPLSNGKNEQFLWALLNVRDKDSPIYCWPMHVVNTACRNRSTGNSQAEPEYFFPLLVTDLNHEFVNKILPLIVPTMRTHGLLLLGRPGIGKTPLAIVLSLAVTRYTLSSRNLTDAMVGWRRSKQIDGFRDRPGEISVPVLLDDPILPSMSLEDIKSFLDVGETTLVDARYRAAKFERNQVRILLNNEWNPDKEPDLPFYDHIGWQHFKDMFHSAMNEAPMPHLMAILKRGTVVIAGHKAVYVRLASEHQSERIHRFQEGGITEGWLRGDNKSYYSHYKEGRCIKYPSFEDSLNKEQDLMHELLASPEEKEYMRRGATYDSWHLDFENETVAESIPMPSTPPRRSSAEASARSPQIHSPPQKQQKTQSEEDPQSPDPDEEAARDLHSQT